jgi:hypothetical protein
MVHAGEGLRGKGVPQGPAMGEPAPTLQLDSVIPKREDLMTQGDPSPPRLCACLRQGRSPIDWNHTHPL